MTGTPPNGPEDPRTALHWVTSAKRQATRDRRLDTLIEDSAAGRRIRQLGRTGES